MACIHTARSSVDPTTLILGTAGHIDHGKTALVRALTGIDTDRLPEEKQRGITIDLGFANLDLGAFNWASSTCPGHERFVKNMLAGAVGVDLALLVVAADDSVMPQTREHLDILRLLGVRARSGGNHQVRSGRSPAGTWSRTKSVSSCWHFSWKRTDRAHGGSARRRSGTRSGLTWQAIGAVCEQVVGRSDATCSACQSIAAFTVPGRGTVVTGTVWSGQLKVRDEVEWLPIGKTLVVRSLQTHGHDTDLVERGQRAAVNLVGSP